MKFHSASSTTSTGAPPIVSLQTFCQQSGIAVITAWRFRKRGWLKTVNISGRLYITAEAIEEFKRRALAGEFATEHKTPSQKARA